LNWGLSGGVGLVIQWSVVSIHMGRQCGTLVPPRVCPHVF
jgi:hypothetical protein